MSLAIPQSSATPRPSSTRTSSSTRLVTATLLAAALGLAACGDDAEVADPTATATPADGEQSDAAPDASASPEATASSDAATDEATDDPTAPADCSAAGLPDDASADGLAEPIAEAAAFLLDAAVRCDEQLLVTAATEGDTTLTFGDVPPEEFFALPEDEGTIPAHYEVVARLLGQTSPVLADDGSFAVWPAVFEEPDVDAHWDELVSSGLYDQQEVDEMRAFGEETGSGYLGWRLGIAADGSFQFLVAGE